MNLSQMLDAERNTLRFDEVKVDDTPRKSVSHRKYSTLLPVAAQTWPDHYKRSILSLFICFIWGALALRASRKARECNQRHLYSKAEYYSKTALSHNKSALACFVVMLLILVLPLTVSLLHPLPNLSKYLNARQYFG